MSEIRSNLLLPDCVRWPKSQPVIELRGVWKRFGDLEVIRGLDLVVQTGKTTVIAGESGSGKSVLLKMMNGLILPDEGEVYLFGQALSQLNEKERTLLRKRCTMVFQNYALIDSMTVADNIAFPLIQNTSMSTQSVYRLVQDLLTLLELPNTGDLLPSALSGGMKKRVALARAVISNPEVVLFDEPTTGLDPVMIEFVDEMIAKTQKNYEITSVIISHDMASNRRLADHMAILSEGVIAERGTFNEVKSSQVPAVRSFMEHIVTERMQRVEVEDEHSSPSSPHADPSHPHADPPHPHADPPHPHADPSHPSPSIEGLYAARLFDVRKSFGDREILKGISLDIPSDQITVIIGGSGSGKSVLVKHIIGLFQPSSGRVEVLGQEITSGDASLLRETQKQIGVLFQGAALFDSMSVEDNIGFPLIEGRRMKKKVIRPLVEEIAEKINVQELLKRFPDSISNGERKRVALARALITKPKIMIYDEPTTGQDPIMMRRVDDMIVEAAELFDMTSIVISHDMGSTFRIADQIAMIYQGHLAVHGPPHYVQRSRDSRVQEFIFAGQKEQ